MFLDTREDATRVGWELRHIAIIEYCSDTTSNIIISVFKLTDDFAAIKQFQNYCYRRPITINQHK